MPEYWEIPRQWEGATAVVMASGESLTRADAQQVRHLPRITTNASFRMAPDAEILYGGDVFFWRHPTYRDVFDCPGVRLCVEQVPGVAPHLPEGVRVIRNAGRQGFTERRGAIKTGGNSGFAAIHLAASMGAKRIIVLGLDMCGGHWHGAHPHGLNNPRNGNFLSCTRNFRTLAPALASRGIEVLNCSPISELKAFPKVSLASVL